MGPDMDLGASLTVGDLRGPTPSRRRWAPIACLSALVVIGIMSEAEVPVPSGVFGRDLLAPDSDVAPPTEADDHRGISEEDRENEEQEPQGALEARKAGEGREAEMAKKRDLEAREKRLKEEEERAEKAEMAKKERDLEAREKRLKEEEKRAEKAERDRKELVRLKIKEEIRKEDDYVDVVERDKAIARKDRKEVEARATITFIVVAIVAIIGVSGYAMSRCSCGPGVQGGPNGGGNLVVAGKTELKNHGR